MASSDYDELQADAADLIKEFGRTATLKLQHSAPDANEPWKPGTPSEDVATVKGVFIKYKQKEVNGEQIQSGDQYVLLAGNLTIDPNLKGTIIDGTLSTDPLWKIVRIISVKPGPVQMLYKVQVRQ